MFSADASSTAWESLWCLSCRECQTFRSTQTILLPMRRLPLTRLYQLNSRVHQQISASLAQPTFRLTLAQVTCRSTFTKFTLTYMTCKQMNRLGLETLPAWLYLPRSSPFCRCRWTSVMSLRMTQIRHVSDIHSYQVTRHNVTLIHVQGVIGIMAARTQPSILMERDQVRSFHTLFERALNLCVLVVPFRLVLGFNIIGLIGTKHAAADVHNAECPITLPINSVWAFVSFLLDHASPAFRTDYFTGLLRDIIHSFATDIS